MRIEYLTEFADLARTLSYTETARNQAVSESALSRHIRAVEDELGVVLFERTSRRVRLTGEGARLLHAADSVGTVWSGYLAQLRTARTRSADTIDVAANYFVSDQIAAFLAHRPSSAIRQLSQGEPSAALLQHLERGECDFVVVTSPVAIGAHVESFAIASDSFVAVLPTAHRLSSADALCPEDLATDPFISFHPGSIGDEWIRRICERAGFEPNVIFSSEVGSSIAQLVADGLGVTFLQKRTISKMHPHDVTLVDIDPPVRVQALLCWDGRRPLPPAARAFRDYLREHATP